MGLGRNLSIIADSTVASSPPSLASSPVSIKHTARTYGRRRDELDNSFNSEQDSRDSILLTGPQNLSDEIPPSEPLGSVDSDEEDTIGDASSSSLKQPNIGFGWREKMREIDGKDDLNDYTRDTSERASEFPSMTSTLMDPESRRKAELTGLSSNVPPENVSGGSPLSPNTILQSTFWDLSSRVSSPGAPPNRPRIQKISDSALQDEEKRPICPSSPQSPSSHLLATPNSRRTSSPPTSHHDANSAPSSASKRNGGVLESKNTVVMLPLGEKRTVDTRDLEGASATRSHGRLSQREKKQRVKPPTREERREIARERARLAAGQEISINRFISEEKSIRTLFAGVQAKLLSSQSHIGISKQLSSPIDDFSSSQSHLHSHTRSLSPRKHLVCTSVEESDSDRPSNLGTVSGTAGGKSIGEAPVPC